MVAAAFNDVEGEQFPPEGWKPNETLPEALIRTARQELKWWQWRKRRAIVTVLSNKDFRFVLEAELTNMAMRAGALPPTSSTELYDGVPIYVGAWTDLFDWIIANWPAIMEMIMSIISLFNEGGRK